MGVSENGFRNYSAQSNLQILQKNQFFEKRVRSKIFSRACYFSIKYHHLSLSLSLTHTHTHTPHTLFSFQIFLQMSWDVKATDNLIIWTGNWPWSLPKKLGCSVREKLLYSTLNGKHLNLLQRSNGLLQSKMVIAKALLCMIYFILGNWRNCACVSVCVCVFSSKWINWSCKYSIKGLRWEKEDVSGFGINIWWKRQSVTFWIPNMYGIPTMANSQGRNLGCAFSSTRTSSISSTKGIGLGRDN